MKAKTLVSLLVIAVVAMTCWPFLPTNLGGNATYVATHGTSMIPRFHAGDIAVVKPTSKYRVGDIAAYRSDTLHGAVVLHRIIAIDGGHFTFKGDNNTFVDADHPTADQLVGKLAVQLPHGGQIRSVFTKPLVVFPLVAIAFAGLASGLFLKKRRRQKPARRTASVRGEPPHRDRVRVVVPVAAALGVFGCLIAAIAVSNTQTTVRANQGRPYTQTITLGYSASAPKGATYPDGVVRTGDPLFTHLVHRVAFDVALDFAYAGASHIAGTYDITADVTSTSGWSHHLALTPVRSFSGNHAIGAAVLDLNAIRQLQQEFAHETGLDPAGTNVAVSSHAHIDGSANGTPVTLDNTATMNFSFSDVALLPAQSGGSSPSNAPAAISAKSAVVDVTGRRATALELGPVTLPLATARLLAILGIAAFLGGGALALRAHARRVALGETAAIDARYGPLLVQADDIPRGRDQSVVTVESMRMLARLAQQHDQLILHARNATNEEYAVLTDSAVYRYRAPQFARSGRVQ